MSPDRYFKILIESHSHNELMAIGEKLSYFKIFAVLYYEFRIGELRSKDIVECSSNGTVIVLKFEALVLLLHYIEHEM